MNTNVSTIHNCFGCGVCAASCGKKIISIELNRDGFYEPRITEESQCTHCGICTDVCAFSHTELANNEAAPVKSWAAWSNDEDVRHKCSSGGISYEIGKQLIEKGYHAVGCRYDIKEQRAEHYIATTVEDFTASVGSKYIQSYTAEAFSQIKKRGQKYLVTGTPCQIDSFRRMIRKFKCEEDFILLDFYCHSIPSMHVWKAYIKMLEARIGKIEFVSWRNKFDYNCKETWQIGTAVDRENVEIDWHDSYNLHVLGERKMIQSRMSQGDVFFRLSLGDIAIGTQCVDQCKYKYANSSADIRIGDLWGDFYKDDRKGVSALIAFTEKGQEIVESLKDVTLIEHPFEVVAEGQMKKNAKAKEIRNIVIALLRNKVSLNSFLFKIIYNTQRVISKLKR